jgi:hypothetical protein
MTCTHADIAVCEHSSMELVLYVTHTQDMVPSQGYNSTLESSIRYFAEAKHARRKCTCMLRVRCEDGNEHIVLQ